MFYSHFAKGAAPGARGFSGGRRAEGERGGVAWRGGVRAEGGLRGLRAVVEEHPFQSRHYVIDLGFPYAMIV